VAIEENNVARDLASREDRIQTTDYTKMISTGIPGKSHYKKDTQLEIAESAHAYFLNFTQNKKKTVSPPPCPCTVLNRWWKSDYKTRYERQPHADWADLIDFVEEGYGAVVSWLTRTRGKT